jgi:hypothetical protein
MQPEQLRCIAKQHGKDFGVIVLGNADRRCDPQRLEQVRDRVAVSDDERVAGQCTQFLDKCANIICRNHCGTDCAALAVGAAVSCVRLNSVTNTDVIFESFRIALTHPRVFVPRQINQDLYPLWSPSLRDEQ